MRQLLKVRVLVPHRLGDHLRQLHGGDGRRQPAIRREHIDAGLRQSNGLA